jgi:hypothetical protein
LWLAAQIVISRLEASRARLYGDPVRRELVEQLGTCNLKAAAFDLARGLGGGVYRKEMAASLSLFTTLPSPETAAILVAACPEALELMGLASDSFTRSLPVAQRGHALQGYDEWMASFESNLRAADAVQSFLLKEAEAGRVRIGFHAIRDQAPLYGRLALIGIGRVGFPAGRPFLREIITCRPSAFRAIIDMVCIHGVQDGRERFWNGLGAELDAQLHPQSEIMFDVSQVLDEFVAMLSSIGANQ